MADFDESRDTVAKRGGIKEKIIQELDKRFRDGEPTADDWNRFYAEFPDQGEFLDAERKARFKSHREITKLAQNLAEDVRRKYLVGSMPTHKIAEKMVRYRNKNNWTNAQFEAFRRAFIALLSGKRATDVENNQMLSVNRSRINRALGGPVLANIQYQERGLRIKESDNAIVSEIIKLMDTHSDIHTKVLYQSLMYRDLGIVAISGEFDRTKNDPSDYIHPVIAALFLPKIDVLDIHMLHSDLGKIIKYKYDKKPINDMANNLLLRDITVDPNDVICDASSPMTDILNRYRVQIALWQTVLSLRNGQYYGSRGMRDLMKHLSVCRNNLFDNAELSFTQNDGAILRRLFSVFSFRPTFIATRKLAHVMDYMQMFQSPFNQQLTNQQDFTNPILTYHTTTQPMPTLTEIPMLNIQIPYHAGQAGGSRTPMDLQTQQTIWLYESESKRNVPREHTVISSNGILVFHVNRHAPKVNIQTLTHPLAFSQLPLTNGATLQDINDYPINVSPIISIGPNGGGEIYQLRSVVALTDTAITASNISTRIITGSIAILIDPTTGSYYRYDPFKASQPVLYTNTTPTPGVPAQYYVNNKPISSIDPHFSVPDPSGQPTGAFEIAATHGTIFVYVPHKQYVPQLHPQQATLGIMV